MADKKESAEQREQNFRYWLQKDVSSPQSLGIGIHDNQFYFGKKVSIEGKPTDVVITSNREKYVGGEIKTLFGLNHRFDLFSDCIDYTWHNEGIDRWLFDEGLEEEEYSLKKCFEEIKKKNQEYIYHHDERIHDFIALDLLATYFRPIFESMGRLFFLAEKRSGKTKQTQLYGLMAFNPIMTSDISPASFYRIIESTGGTLLIDDFDIIDGELKAKMIQHIRTGYKFGSKAIRSDSNKANRPVGYNNYAHVVLNNTLGLDEITEDRCNKILLLRTNDKKLTSKKLNPKSIDWQILRDKIHICTLLNWKQVKKSYQSLDYDVLSDRDLERVEGILSIANCIDANCIDDKLFERVLILILELNEQQNLKEIKDNWDFILFEHLYHTIKEDLKIKLKDIANVLAPTLFNPESNDYERKKKAFNVKAGKILNSISLFKRSVSMGYVHYDIKRKSLLKYIELKGYDKYIEGYSTNSTTSTIPTTPTTSTKKLVEAGEVVEAKLTPKEK